MRKYTEKDMVKVVDAAGNALPSVPKAWTEKGRDLLPPGVKRGSGGSKAQAEPEPDPAP